MKRLPTRKACTCPPRIPAPKPSGFRCARRCVRRRRSYRRTCRLRRLLHQMKDSAFDAWPVGDAEGLWGMIRSSELEQAADEGASNQKVAEILAKAPGAATPPPKSFRTFIPTTA